MINRTIRHRRLLLASALSLLATPAFAEEAADAGADSAAEEAPSGDILVTATRTSAAVSRVPISISAYSQEKMDAQGIRSIDDLARLTPGVTFNRSGRTSQIAIRGVTSTIGAATTAIYIDDTPIQVRTVGNSATNGYPRIFDLERVEVLRGPQGTLFGASSQGGSIRFITPRPNFDGLSVYARGEVSFTEGGAPNYEGGVAVGAPIVGDKIAFRISGWYRKDGGFVDRYSPVTLPATPSHPIEKNNNSADAVSGRLAVSVKLGEAVTVTPSISFQREHADSQGLFFSTLSNPAAQDFRSAYVVDPYINDRFVLPGLLIEAELGGVNLISNTSYFDRRFDTLGDFTYWNTAIYGARVTALTLPDQVATAGFVNTQKNFSQEIRLQSNGDGPLKWVVGGFYTRARQFQGQDITDAYLDQLIRIRTGGASSVRSIYGSEMLPGNLFFYTELNTVDEQLAGFAQADYELFNGFKITAGVRVSRTRFETDVLRDGPLSGGRSFISASQSETPVTPKFGISWQVDPDTLLYASVAKGYRPGGAQAQLSRVACAVDLNRLGLTDTPATFGSDSLWSYEIGAKSRLFDNLLTLDASAYVIKWKNIQQEVNFSSCSGRFVDNQGSATSKGFDLALQLRPARGLTLATTIAVNNTTFDQTITQGPSIIRSQGEKLRVRPFTLTFSGEYQFGRVGSIEPYFRGDYQYLQNAPDRNPLAFGYDAGLPASPLDEVNNLRLRLGARAGRLDFAVFADNVLNDSPVNYSRIAGSSSTILIAQAERPRTIGLFVAYRH